MNKTGRMSCALAALLLLSNASAASAAPPPTVVDSETIINALQPHTSGTRSLVVAPRGGGGGAAAGSAGKMILDIRFANDSARLTPDALAQLAQLGGALKSERLSGARFLIAGHTSATGSPDHNLRLSDSRARSVRSYLLKRFNIAPARIEATGFGATQPLPGVAPDALEQRRVEISTLPRT